LFKTFVVDYFNNLPENATIYLLYSLPQNSAIKERLNRIKWQIRRKTGELPFCELIN